MQRFTISIGLLFFGVIIAIGIYLGKEYFVSAHPPPDVDCGSLVDCGSCASLQGCGWCSSNKTCMKSNRFGSADGKRCGVDKLVTVSQVCPKAPAPEEVVPPVDVIQETVNMIKEEVMPEGFEVRKTALNPVLEPFENGAEVMSAVATTTEDAPVNYSILNTTYKPVEVNTEEIIQKELDRNGLPSIEGFSSTGDVNAIIQKSIHSKKTTAKPSGV